MKTLFKTLLVLGLVMALVSLALGIGVLGLLHDAPGFHLSIDGEDVFSSGMDLADALGAGLGLVITFGVLVIVLPLVLLLGLGLPLLILAAVLALVIAAVLGVGAVLGSPLLLVVLIVWLLTRDRRPRAAVPPSPAQPAAAGSTPSEPHLSA